MDYLSTKYILVQHFRSLLFINFLILFSGKCLIAQQQSGSAELQTNNVSSQKIVKELIVASEINGNTELLSSIRRLLDGPEGAKYFVSLGNTIPPYDLDKDSEDYAQLNNAFGDALRKMRDQSKKTYYIPGPNEWYDGKDYTVKGLRDTEKFIQENSGGKNSFRPGKGCGEPEVLKISDNWIAILIDSQWMMQGNSSDERKKSSCEIDNNFEFIAAMKEILADNKQKHIIIAAHHPMYSDGKLGGYYPIKNHLLPIPVLGTLITSIRKLAVDDQNIGHPDYESYRAAMNSMLANCDNCIVLSGHENNLQYHNRNGSHFFTVGSAPEPVYVRKATDNNYTARKSGYARLALYDSNELLIELYEFSDQTKPLFQLRLPPKVLEYEASEEESVFLSSLNHGDTIYTQASEIYEKKKFLRGNFYRKAWGSKVPVPAVYLDSMYGGLTPVKQGGGFQTRSLRLENEEGQQWVMRSIHKDVEKIIPPALRGSFAQNMVQDGIAASHPYGAFVIPDLAEKAGVYHANPIAVYLPHQKSLGDYNTEFGNKLYLFEERPGGNTSKNPDYAFAEETVNTLELLENLEKSNKHRVDQKAVLRARLFDIWIGDWDRHDDQWRWGVYEEKDFKIYRPIPRDRDQVFFKNDGFLDYLASRPYFNPGLRKFGHKIDFLPGLIFNARHFDRSFLNQLDLKDFIDAARDLQESMDDATIEKAFTKWPDVIRDLDADDIIGKLKSRRADLEKYARKFYAHINKELTVAGTNDKDMFELTSLNNDSLLIEVYHEKKTQKHLIYQRRVSSHTIKEIRLFGLEKDDSFSISGDFPKAAKIRIIGGSGDDLVINGSSAKPVIYDRPKGMEVKEGAYIDEVKDVNGINSYDRKDWHQDRFWQFPLPSFYTDEGIGLSYNIWWKNFGFRTRPYKSDHKLMVAYFLKNSAFNFSYSSYYPEALGSWDLGMNINFNGPSFTQFFYGFGNTYQDFESLYPDVSIADDQSFHIVKGVHLDINSHFTKAISSSSKLSINPSFQFINLANSDDEQRFYLFDEAGILEESLESRLYPAVGVNFISTRVDNPAFPSRGYTINLAADFKYNVSDSQYKNLNLSSKLSAYIPFNPSKSVVFASHLGFNHLVGTAEFFHLNYLSDRTRLRGYRTNRFSGETMAYHANDLRISLTETKGELPAVFGIILSYDYGRVWLDRDTENADTWHSSYGGGIFFAPLNLIGFKLAYYKSPNEFQLSIGGSLSF